MISVRRAIAESTRSRIWPLHFQTQSSFSFSSYTTSNFSPYQSKVFQKESPPLPRPTEIPYQSKVANSVSLIGYVTERVQLSAAADGKRCATSVITQLDSASPPSLRIPIIFEGDLANVALCHIKKHDRVYVAGQLSAIPGQTQLQIMVQNVNFVTSPSEITKTIGSCQQREGYLKDNVSANKDGGSALDSWKDLLENPKQWWDYRNSKLNGLANPKHPDFKRKDGVSSLWLGRGVPRSILSELEKMEFDVHVPVSKQVKTNKGDESWKHLVENTNKWWDNRSNKRNVKAPDFKHKETGEVLWLSSAPAWVLSQLPPVKSEEVVAVFKRDTLLS